MLEGGADGFEEQVFDSAARASTFLHASKAVDYVAHIKKTIKQLKDFGRDLKVRCHYFLTPIASTDALEGAIATSYAATLRIRRKVTSKYISPIRCSPPSVTTHTSARAFWIF